jgi:hypothetical protein
MKEISEINGRISEKYYSIKENIRGWNFEKLTGIGQQRKHDKYAILELNIYPLENYPSKEEIHNRYDPYYLRNFSFLTWELSESQFPKDVYEQGKAELILGAEAAIDVFSLIKEQDLKLVFEIIWVGYAETDSWGRSAVNQAFLNAVLSCFDNKLYHEGLKYKENHFFRDGELQCRFSPSST